MIFNGSSDEYLELQNITSKNCYLLKEKKEQALTLVWFLDEHSELIVDNKSFQFSKNDMLCLTDFHNIQVKRVGQIKMARFNRSFYCILDHDKEIGCKGVLFFGASRVPVFHLPSDELKKFELFWTTFEMEMEANDGLQLEMLQMMLKRLLILSTRIYKSQTGLDKFEMEDQNIVRQYNFLIEQHFKTHHTVSEYAKLLYKSPKTLSNLFAQLGKKPPLYYVQNRIMLEAKRLLHYTDKSITEIAYELGYEDVQSFSRFFKKQQGMSPVGYKKEKLTTL